MPVRARRHLDLIHCIARFYEKKYKNRVSTIQNLFEVIATMKKMMMTRWKKGRLRKLNGQQNTKIVLD
ncbi:hypothetical protein E2C01_014569 [Portunus trituberculatus]|uniref:Uncharacterized protein n=1 Tax=Portunus trituberculatus TaxID=210409 RepID=A0A5B7DJ66_PORTR|nr:hypothetical protein [Portunus trituberculatus]